MTPPIFSIIHENGDLLIHSSVERAESYHEPYDINEPFTIYDATGQLLQQKVVSRHIVPKIQLTPVEQEPLHAAELSSAIRTWLSSMKSLGKWRGEDQWLATASLEELVAVAILFSL